MEGQDGGRVGIRSGGHVWKGHAVQRCCIRLRCEAQHLAAADVIRVPHHGRSVDHTRGGTTSGAFACVQLIGDWSSIVRQDLRGSRGVQVCQACCQGRNELIVVEDVRVAKESDAWADRVPLSQRHPFASRLPRLPSVACIRYEERTLLLSVNLKVFSLRRSFHAQMQN